MIHPDGTGVRDYIHVVDLAKGHVKAIEKLAEKKGVLTYNLGTGKGYSVLDIVKAFSKAAAKKSSMRLNLVVPAILIHAIQMPLWLKQSLAGKRRKLWRICVPIPGDGRKIIRTDTRKIKNNITDINSPAIV